MSLCKDCVTGVRHEGTPEGKIETVNGVKVYIATPKVDYPKDKALLFLTDVFGLDLINNQLLADDFARNGFYTIIPDYLNGDPLAPDAFSKPDFNIADWFKNHMAEQTRPPLDKVIAWLKGNGVKEFAATGYCFGARYVFDLAFGGIIKASVVSHPSLLNVQEDMSKYVKEVKAPLLINSCTHDTQFPLEAQAKTDAIFADEKAPLYKRVYFGGCTHGFAVRGDLKDPKVKAGKEGAFRAAVEWFMEHV